MKKLPRNPKKGDQASKIAFRRSSPHFLHGAISIVRPVDLQSSTLPLSCGCSVPCTQFFRLLDHSTCSATYLGVSVAQWLRDGLLDNMWSDRSCTRGMIPLHSLTVQNRDPKHHSFILLYMFDQCSVQENAIAEQTHPLNSVMREIAIGTTYLIPWLPSRDPLTTT